MKLDKIMHSDVSVLEIELRRGLDEKREKEHIKKGSLK